MEFARQSRLNVIYIGIKRDSQALQEQCEQACGSEWAGREEEEGAKVAVAVPDPISLQQHGFVGGAQLFALHRSRH